MITMKALKTQVLLCVVSIVAVVQVHSESVTVSEQASEFQSSNFFSSSSSDKKEERFSSIKEQDFFEQKVLTKEQEGSSATTQEEIIKREESSIIKREESPFSNQELFQREESLLISDQKSSSFQQQQQSSSFKEQEMLSLVDQEFKNIRPGENNNMTTLVMSENIFSNAKYSSQMSNVSETRKNATIVTPGLIASGIQTAVKPISDKDKEKTIEVIETITTASSSADAQMYVVKKEEEEKINDDGSVTIEEIESITKSSNATASQTSVIMKQEHTSDGKNSTQATTATETAVSTSSSNSYQSSQTKSGRKGKVRQHAQPLPRHPNYLQLRPNQQPIPKISPQTLLTQSKNPESVWRELPDLINNGQSYYPQRSSKQSEGRDCNIYDIINKKNDRVGKALQADLNVNFLFYNDGKDDQCQCACGTKKKPFYITVDLDKIKDYQLN